MQHAVSDSSARVDEAGDACHVSIGRVRAGSHGSGVGFHRREIPFMSEKMMPMVAEKPVR